MAVDQNDQETVREYRMRRLRSTAAWEAEWSTYERYFRHHQATALLLHPLTSASPPKWLLYVRGAFDGEYYSKPAALRALHASKASDGYHSDERDTERDNTDGMHTR